MSEGWTMLKQATRSVALVIKSGRIVFAENPAPSSPAGM
jgi:hypothetical protein